MGRLALLLLALVAAIAVAGLSTSNAAQQSAKNGCTSNTPFNGTLTTPPFPTPAVAPTVSFDTWWETESVNTQGVDTKVVEASNDGVNWTVVDTLNEDLPAGETGRPDRPWSNIGLDLKPNWETHSFGLPAEFLSQQTVQLRFNFNTADSLFNGFRGWGVDNVRVTESVNFFFGPVGFDGGFVPEGWEATGFWTVPGAPEDTAIHSGINPPLITLGTTDGTTQDFGLLPANLVVPGAYAWFGQESTATYCGENFQTVLALDPFTAERTTGTSHTVNANLQNVIFETAFLRWSVTGANPTSGSAAVPFGASTTPITWTGTNAGFDSLEVHLDINGVNGFEPDEILQFAEVNWTASAAQPQQPAQQQPAQQQPQQQQPRRDPFPADVETAPTLDGLSTARRFEEINIAAEDGLVFVRLPGGRGGARASQTGTTPSGFIPLTQAAQVPVGSIVEASRGRISLESTNDARGLRTQRAQFFDGRFQMRQPRSRRPVTEMVLKGGSFRGCPRAGKSSAGDGPEADASQRRRQGRRVRRVWGNGRGNFRTRGRYSSATVRGTTWLTEDRCGGTLTRVAARPRTNRVVVQDFVTRRSRLLRAGQSYFAARPLGRR